MTAKEVRQPIPATKRYLAVKAIIEKEAAPLLSELGEEIVSELERIARTPGGSPVRKPMSDEYLDALAKEGKKDVGKKVYEMFRRACRGTYARYGKLFHVDERGMRCVLKSMPRRPESVRMIAGE
jgi:hypothetical protein